ARGLRARARLAARRRLGARRCRSARRRGRRALGAFRRLLLFLGLLYLLDDDLDHLDLGQTKRAAAVRPVLLGLEPQDAFAARQHVAGALQRVLAAQAFIDGHRTFLSDQEWFIIKTARNIDKRCPVLA